MTARRHLIAALSEDSMGGIATLQDVDHAEQLVDAHRTEVLHEAADMVETAFHSEPFLNYPPDFADLLRETAKSTREEVSAPDFFQPGRTYTHVDDETDWKFRVDKVTTHPEDGERTALGWRHFRGAWEPYAYGEDDYEIHLRVGITNVTEAGEGQ
jgi:hypothetical protein